MTYVLIIWMLNDHASNISSAGGRVVTTQEFSSEANCKAAGDFVAHNDSVKWGCFRK